MGTGKFGRSDGFGKTEASDKTGALYTSSELEKYSSAITLSDMEVFVFPELAYSLVLANIMSPVIWDWRKEDCFLKLDGKSSYRKLLRLRQYIMDEFEFNLDLDTWGLTSRKREIKRFENFISPQDLAASNALFGYEGDKYYFDVDIRKHFGLDKYDGDIIPYWKTETVEAMKAFRYKKGFNSGAGECVSLSTLYAAAAFIVGAVVPDDIYMVLTPLHSQNFIDTSDGIITNNRRLVTKSMWFNGTEISNKAQRALRNEQVTIVAHPSGYIHCLYDRATIRKVLYDSFAEKLKGFLSEGLDLLTLANFLRCNRDYQPYFQFCRKLRGQAMFVKAEVLFGYEHGSGFRTADQTYDKLLEEVSEEDYARYKDSQRLCCEQFMTYIREQGIDIAKKDDRAKAGQYLDEFMSGQGQRFMEQLYDFLHVEPRLPGTQGRQFVESRPFSLSAQQSRAEIIDYLKSIRSSNPTVDLAFYAYRDMQYCRWEPFMKAAVERNPVSIEAAKEMPEEQVYRWLAEMPDESIYDGRRLAQPDEVANYGRGDGVEKAITLANILHNRRPDEPVEINIDNHNVIVNVNAGSGAATGGKRRYEFRSVKGLVKQIRI